MDLVFRSPIVLFYPESKRPIRFLGIIIFCLGEKDPGAAGDGAAGS